MNISTLPSFNLNIPETFTLKGKLEVFPVLIKGKYTFHLYYDETLLSILKRKEKFVEVSSGIELSRTELDYIGDQINRWFAA